MRRLLLSRITPVSLMLSSLGWAAGAAPVAGNPPGLNVRVQEGKLLGRSDGAVEAYLGIPYAAPPTGANRWRAPQAPLKWTGVRPAVEYGASCTQQVLPGGRPPWTREYMVQGKVSEDCLTLNIWTPAHDDGRRPVLVWIHGGGFNEGSASVPIYRGASLAGRDIVVVTINYRLGLFGFLAHPELTAEAGTGIPSNFGLQDQIAALRWVQQNIATFGGDPAQVTIAGQSAGSISVHSLVASPLTQGLFVRAIAESGLPNLIPIQSLAEAERNGELFAHDKGAVSLAKLRSMSAAELVSPAGASMGAKYQFGLVVDGKLLPQSPIDLMKQGRSHDIPMLIGQNADEGSAFPGYGAGDKPAFQAFMARSFEGEAATFSRFYAGENDTERSQAVKSASRDRGLASMDQWLLLRSKAGKTPVWAYYYSHAEPGPDSAKFGAFHSSEIPYVLSTLDMAPGRNFSFTDRLLNLTMSSYWINFIKSGDPNGDRLMSWPAINADSPRLMEFGDVVAIRPLLEADKLKAYRGYAIKGGAFSMF